MTKNCPFCDSSYVTITVPVKCEDCGAVGPVRNVLWDDRLDRTHADMVSYLEEQVEYLEDEIRELEAELAYYER